MLKCDYPGCIKEFETPKSLSSHRAWHTRKERSRIGSIASILSTPIPQPVSQVKIELDSEGNLKIDIKKENKTEEEFESL